MGRIRPFVRDDIEQVATLHQRVFSDGDPPVPPKLSRELLQSYVDYFEMVFSRNPWQDEALPSFIHEEADGRISGFLGVLPRRMLLNGESISVAISSQFIVDPESRATGAGVRLMKTFLTGPQELSFTDEANNTSRKLWEGLGGTTALLYCIHWTRLLRPSRYAVNRFLGSGLLPSAINPFCRIADSVLTRRMPHRFEINPPEAYVEEMNTETLLDCISEFANARALWPQYDDRSLNWLVGLLERKKESGNLRKMVVRNARGETLGWFLYQLKPNEMSNVVQLMAKKNQIEPVLESLFYDAWTHDSIALTGRIDPQFMQSFREKNCLFDCGAPWMLIASPNRDVIEAFQKGNAMLSSLEGELGVRFS